MKDFTEMGNNQLIEEKAWAFERAQAESKNLKKCDTADDIYKIIKYLSYLHDAIEKIEAEQTKRLREKTSYLKF